MVQERLEVFEAMYSLRRRELHEQMVILVEAQMLEAGFAGLDERLRQAMLRVRRDRHVPIDHYLKRRDPVETLEDVYRGRILNLDSQQFIERLSREMVSRNVDLSRFSDEEIHQLVTLFEAKFKSTISDPLIVAITTQSVLPNFTEQDSGGKTLRALDIGAGLGYQSAILRAVGFRVDAIEIKPYLVERAEAIAQGEGYDGIRFLCGDGRLGNPEGAPYDAIVVAAAVCERGVVKTLGYQLRIGGRLVVPEVVEEFQEEEIMLAGERFSRKKDRQILRVYERVDADIFFQRDLLPVTFVYLQEWDP